MIDPPDDVAADRLFRLLITRPRPVYPVAHRVRGAEEVELHVRALRGVEDADAFATGDGAPTRGVRDSRIANALMVAALWVGDEKAFVDDAQLVRLTPLEHAALLGATIRALSVVSPCYARCNPMTWGARLKQGAQHPRNIREAVALGDCTDVSLGAGARYTVGRPDRYFGFPIADTTDGQRMAFDAARSFVDDLRKK